METPRTNLNGQCGRCDNRWGGLNTCHCAACHRTFSGISAFDAHRIKDTCRDPEALHKKDGARILTQRERAGYSVWAFPEQDDRAFGGAA